jgi:protein gp37
VHVYAVVPEAKVGESVHPAAVVVRLDSVLTVEAAVRVMVT